MAELLSAGGAGLAGQGEPRADDNWLYRPKFPDHWKRGPLYSLARWVNGLAFRNIEFSATGKPIIKIAEIKGGISGQTKFTQQSFDESVRVLPGDLLFSWSGQPETSIDASWWQGPEGWLNQHVFRLTVEPEVDETFFYYLLRHLKPNFVGIARNKQTTGLGHVTKRDLQAIEVGVPPLDEQRAIAHVLGTLDDKIELNSRMNETLEAMARALFRSWFVDFEPVRAKMEGRWRPGESLPGLPAHLHPLFPDRLVPSELGDIPEGWEVVPAGQAVTVHGGSTPSTKEPSYWDGKHCFATPKDLSLLQEPVLAATARRLTDSGVARIGSGLLPSGTLLLSSRAPIGYLAITETPVAINQGIIAMACDGPVGAPYALNWTRANMEAIEARASGTTFAEISKSSFRDLPFLTPSQPVHAAYEAIAGPLYRRVSAISRQSRDLAIRRDTVLPRLVAGKLPVEAK